MRPSATTIARGGACALILPWLLFTVGMMAGSEDPSAENPSNGNQDDGSLSQPPREMVDPRAMIEKADEFLEAGKSTEASELYRKALFVRPTEKKALNGWQKIQKARAADFAAQAVAAFEEDPRRGHSASP